MKILRVVCSPIADAQLCQDCRGPHFTIRVWRIRHSVLAGLVPLRRSATFVACTFAADSSGMENSCLTFATPTIVAGDRSAVDVCAHEISHVSFSLLRAMSLAEASELVRQWHWVCFMESFLAQRSGLLPSYRTLALTRRAGPPTSRD